MNDQVNDLLDGTLDDIADLPSFEPFPSGAYRVLASFAVKPIKGHGLCPELSFKLLECLQLAETSDVPPNEGSEASTLYMLDNEVGAGKFKKIAAKFVDFAGSRKNRDIIDAVKDVECVLLSSVTIDKNDSTRRYLDVIDITVV